MHGVALGAWWVLGCGPLATTTSRQVATETETTLPPSLWLLLPPPPEHQATAALASAVDTAAPVTWGPW